MNVSAAGPSGAQAQQRPSMLPESKLEQEMKPEAPLKQALDDSLRASGNSRKDSPVDRKPRFGDNVDEKG